LGDEVNDAVNQLASDDAEARREVLAFHRRQRQWSHMMEEQVAERTATIENVLSQAQNLHAERRSVIQGFSHDLRSPFQVATLSNQMLLRDRGEHTDKTVEVLEDQSVALAKMKQMLEDLVKAASKETGLIRLSPQRLEVEPLVDQLRRRLRAFVHGRDIRVSVFSTREAPDVIETDRLLFDRVIDNLLTNAAKYTERGSIVVELDGKPEFLTIKVSDTGRGIAGSDIERIFREGGSDPNRRTAGSYGVGLSVVVQLLGQIGGQLEVKSMPGKGTTFWAHFPVEIRKEEKPEAAAPQRKSKPTPEELVVQVVKIRKSQPP
jgi:signal transduction histidine kinase